MNILQAKNEIKNTVQAYLSKDSFVEYEMEAKNQRPLLLIGPPGIGKTQIMEQIAKECQMDLSAIQYASYASKCCGPSFYSRKEISRKDILDYGIHNE